MWANDSLREGRNKVGVEMENRPRETGGRTTTYDGRREKDKRIELVLQKEIRV